MTPDTPNYTLVNLTQPTAPKRRRWPIPAAIAAAVVVAAATGTTVWLLTRAPSLPTIAPGTPVFTIGGFLDISQGGFIWKSQNDPTCVGLSGYDDLRGGTKVTVFDAGGKALVVGKLDTGHAVDITDGHAGACRLSFSIGNVPRGVGPYGVAVANRQAGHYPESELLSQALELQV